MRPGLFTIENRFRYNPDVDSLVAMVPGTIALLLLLIPAVLSALSVVREKEMGSIVNLYVTPVTKLEFLLGKQIPYVILAMISYLLLVLLAVTVFGVPLKGGFFTLTLGALLYVTVGHLFWHADLHLCEHPGGGPVRHDRLHPDTGSEYSGLIDPVSSLEGMGALISKIYPTTYFLTIIRGTFNKALSLPGL